MVSRLKISLLFFLCGLVVAAGVLCAPNAAALPAHCGDESHKSASLWCQDAHEHYSVISKALSAAASLILLVLVFVIMPFAHVFAEVLHTHKARALASLRRGFLIPPLFQLLFSAGILHPKSP